MIKIIPIIISPLIFFYVYYNVVFLTDQNRALLTNLDGSLTDRGNQILNQTPMGRFGNAQDIVSSTLYLCDDNSSFVTGVVIPIDGGFSAYSGV